MTGGTQPDSGRPRDVPSLPSHPNASETIDFYLERNPDLSRLIFRVLRQELVASGVVTQEDIEHRAGVTRPQSVEGQERRWSAEERGRLNTATKELAAEHLSTERVEDVVGSAIRDAQEITLSDYVLDPRHKITGPGLIEMLEKFCTPPPGAPPEKWNPESQLDPAELDGLHVRLAQTLLTEDTKLVEIAKQLLSIPDYLEIARALITTDNGIGRVGGKMTGIILTHKALTIDTEAGSEKLGVDLAPDPHPGVLPIDRPLSMTLTAEDVFEAVVNYNDLHSYRTYKHKPLEEVRQLEEQTREVFRNVEFPPEIEKKLEAFVTFASGKGPFMVRSTSLLEDSTDAPFSGIYDSFVFVNHGSFQERLDQLKTAIGQVYGSTFTERAIGYRQRFKNLGLLDSDEQMGVSIQQMVGVQVGKYFITPVSGVGFSYDDNIPDETFEPTDGMISLAFGHGTAIVDQHPENPIRDIHLTKPQHRQERENTAHSIAAASQRQVYAVDMESGEFVRKSIFDLERELTLPSAFGAMISTERRGYFYPGVHGGTPCITFDGLAQEPKFTEKMKWMLNRLRTVFGEEVDTEFASDLKTLTVLQGRHEMMYKKAGKVTFPAKLEDSQLFFEITQDKMVPTHSRENLTHFVYIRPDAYAAINSLAQRKDVISLMRKVVEGIQKLNEVLERGKFVLMGPGRWGTNFDESRFGPPVEFAHISNAGLLIESIESGSGYHFATASGGAHWRTNLKMVDLRVVVIRPQRSTTTFNPHILAGENALGELIPEALAHDIGHIVHVVDVAKQSDGKLLHFASRRADGRALMWIGEQS